MRRSKPYNNKTSTTQILTMSCCDTNIEFIEILHDHQIYRQFTYRVNRHVYMYTCTYGWRCCTHTQSKYGDTTVRRDFQVVHAFSLQLRCDCIRFDNRSNRHWAIYPGRANQMHILSFGLREESKHNARNKCTNLLHCVCVRMCVVYARLKLRMCACIVNN